MSETSIFWKNKDAVRQLAVLSSTFGSPSQLVTAPGGSATWSGKKLHAKTCFWSICLKDESIPHCCPGPHHDFLTAGVKVYIPTNTALNKILSISQSLWYDQLEQVLYARCQSMGPVVATLLLATEILRDLGYYPREEDYARLVQASTSKTGYEVLYHQLCMNVARSPACGPRPCYGTKNCYSIFPPRHARPTMESIYYPTAFPHHYADNNAMRDWPSIFFPS